MSRPRRMVHFEFKPHSLGETYKRIPQRVRTHFIEHAHGIEDHYTFSEPLVARKYRQLRKKPDSTFKTTQWRTIAQALRKGKRVQEGEKGTTAEITLLRQLEKNYMQQEKRMNETQTVGDIRRFFVAFARHNRLRHRLIRRIIRSFLEKGETPISSRYGSMHSLLSSELKSEGVASSRNQTPRVYSFDMEILRKLVRKTPPNQISNKDYLRAYISWRCDFLLQTAINRKPNEKINARDVQFADLVSRELLKRLSERTLLKMLKRQNYSLMFTANKLSFPPIRYELIRFLEENSTFYRRELAKQKNRAT